jgi:hypothetical protein
MRYLMEKISKSCHIGLHMPQQVTNQGMVREAALMISSSDKNSSIDYE